MSDTTVTKFDKELKEIIYKISVERADFTLSDAIAIKNDLRDSIRKKAGV